VTLSKKTRRLVVASVGIAILLSGTFVLVEHIHSLRTIQAQRSAHVGLAAMRNADTTKLTGACTRMESNASLNLKAPTIESRQGADLALLFASKTHYSFCLKEAGGNSLSHPIGITQRSSPVYELESVGDLNQVKGLSLYATNEWFVVRVNSSIATLKVVTLGRSEVTSIHDGFALVHETEEVNPGVKGFSYGVVVGFNARGGFVGSASLK
jgi:hypothetical protein